MMIAEPCTVDRSAYGSLKDWSKPNCSSDGVTRAGEHTQRCEVAMQPDGWGWALASTTADGSPPGTEGARIVRLACTPGTEMAVMPTWDPITGPGGEARAGTLIRSQPEPPAGTRSDWTLAVACTGSLTWPVAVCTVTRLTGGPIVGLSAKATRIVPGFTLASKSTWI